MVKKIIILLFMIIGMNLTLRAQEVVTESTAISFPRQTYICGPSVVLGHGTDSLMIIMSPTFEGCKDIHNLWTKDLQDIQVIIEPLKGSKENFTRLRPGINMMPETYKFLCVDIVGYDKIEHSKLYAVDYYIYK